MNFAKKNPPCLKLVKPFCGQSLLITRQALVAVQKELTASSHEGDVKEPTLLKRVGDIVPGGVRKGTVTS